jgi:D-alanyl-D-alanine carboxypeptidase
MLPRCHISLAYRIPDTCWQHHVPFTGRMTYREPGRRTTRRIPTILVVGLLVVLAAVAASLGNSLLTSGSSRLPSSAPASSPSTAASPIAVLSTEFPGALGTPAGVAPNPEMVLRPERRGALGEADGVLPDRVTVFDGRYPGVTNLNPDLLRALRHAATRAAKGGVEFFVTSGWRSRKYQEELFRQAVSEYGSEAKAAHWVATPGTSAHESGNAVDIGPVGAAAWLAKHGAAYGLCQIYGNEPWHYELRREAIAHGCPPMYADPTHDPRMQQ